MPFLTLYLASIWSLGKLDFDSRLKQYHLIRFNGVSIFEGAIYLNELLGFICTRSHVLERDATRSNDKFGMLSTNSSMFYSDVIAFHPLSPNSIFPFIDCERVVPLGFEIEGLDKFIVPLVINLEPKFLHSYFIYIYVVCIVRQLSIVSPCIVSGDEWLLSADTSDNYGFSSVLGEFGEHLKEVAGIDLRGEGEWEFAIGDDFEWLVHRIEEYEEFIISQLGEYFLK